MRADTWVSSLFSFRREGLDELACLLASIQPRTSLVKVARSQRAQIPQVPNLNTLLKLAHRSIKKDRPFACSFLRISDADDAMGSPDDEEPKYPDFVFEAGVLPKVQDEILEQFDVPSSMSSGLCGVAPALDDVTTADCAQKKGSFLRKSTRQETTKKTLLARKHRATEAEEIEAWWETEQNATAPTGEAGKAPLMEAADPSAEPSGSIVLSSSPAEGSSTMFVLTPS